MPQMADDGFAYVQMLDLGKLKYQGRGNMRLLVSALTQIELSCLAVVVGESLGTDAAFLATFSDCGAMKARGRFAWRVLRQGVGLIGHATRRLRHLHMSIALMVGKRTLRCVDWNLVKIG